MIFVVYFDLYQIDIILLCKNFNWLADN